MRYEDLHSALRAEQLAESEVEGIEFQLVCLQHGKNKYTLTLHGFPRSFGTAGVQSTDLLAYLGFNRSSCTFGQKGECFAARVHDAFELSDFCTKFSEYKGLLRTAERHMSACGFLFPQPEGWGYFNHRPSLRRQSTAETAYGDCHRSPTVDRMKDSEDSLFEYVFTWIDGTRDKGWVTHYRAKSEENAGRLRAVFKFFGGLKEFPECPEFDFERCSYRFYRFGDESPPTFDHGATFAHGQFASLSKNFSPAFSAVMKAHEIMQPFGFSLLNIPVKAQSTSQSKERGQASNSSATKSTKRRSGAEKRDIFVCHASEDKEAVVKPLVDSLRSADISCWYAEAEIKWGDSITSKINAGLKESEFVLVVLSTTFLDKEWPKRELNAALSIEASSGRVKVLPLLVGQHDEVQAIIRKLPLISDKLYLIWTDDPTEVISNLKRILKGSS